MLKITNIKKFGAVAVTAAGLMATTVSYAGTEVAASKDVKNVVEETKKSFITGDLGVSMVSEYISRGLVLENQGAIAQPYLDLYFKLYEGTGFINSVTAQLGFWSSIHSHVQPDNSTSSTRNWYEFDWTPTIAVTFAKNFTLSLAYFEFDSPADSFNTARSINASLAYNDTDLLGAFALHPHVTVLHELSAPGYAGLGADGMYYEVGIAPGYTFSPKSSYPLTLTVPVTAGFGSNNFYAGDSFGFVSGGLTASVPLAFIPAGYGTWTATAGATYYHLGGNVANATASGHEDQYVFSGTVGLAF